jgi:hypothetical protein
VPAEKKTPSGKVPVDLTKLVGRRIVAVQSLADVDGLMAAFGWEETDPSGPYLVLDDGTRLFPSRDEEGNGPGALFWEHADGTNGAIFANKSMGPPRRVER